MGPSSQPSSAPLCARASALLRDVAHHPRRRSTAYCCTAASVPVLTHTIATTLGGDEWRVWCRESHSWREWRACGPAPSGETPRPPRSCAYTATPPPDATSAGSTDATALSSRMQTVSVGIPQSLIGAFEWDSWGPLRRWGGFSNSSGFPWKGRVGRS